MCTVEILFEAKQDITFKTILEETSRESILFDGVSQKVVSEDVTN